MDKSALLSSVLIGISLTLALVSCAIGLWVLVSLSTHRRKRQESAPQTPTSGQLARIEADQAELFAALEKNSVTVKRLSSRQGMRDTRERQADEKLDEAPPVGASKVELLRHYGMSGKVGPAFAKAQLERERSN